MKLWQVGLESTQDTIFLARYNYIVSCDQEERAKTLALKIHYEKFPKDVAKVSWAKELESMNIKYGVWFLGFEIIR